MLCTLDTGMVLFSHGALRHFGITWTFSWSWEQIRQELSDYVSREMPVAGSLLVAPTFSPSLSDNYFSYNDPDIRQEKPPEIVTDQDLFILNLPGITIILSVRLTGIVRFRGKNVTIMTLTRWAQWAKGPLHRHWWASNHNLSPRKF